MRRSMSSSFHASTLVKFRRPVARVSCAFSPQTTYKRTARSAQALHFCRCGSLLLSFSFVLVLWHYFFVLQTGSTPVQQPVFFFFSCSFFIPFFFFQQRKIQHEKQTDLFRNLKFHDWLVTADHQTKLTSLVLQPLSPGSQLGVEHC